MLAKLLLIVIVITLSGCNLLVRELPSVENCQHVSYIRDYSKMKIVAECDLNKSGTER
jgi:hypothetical protein